MKITVRDCLQLDALKGAKVVAGKNGIDNVVSNVTVAEIIENGPFEVLNDNELIITAMYTIKDDVEKQLEFIKKLHNAKSSGIIIFYVGIYVKEISEKLIKLADELAFPIIVMPKKRFDLSYSEVSLSILKLILNSDKSKHILSEDIYDKLFQIANEDRSINKLLEIIVKEIDNGIILTNVSFRPIAWYFNDECFDINMEKLNLFLQNIDNKKIMNRCEFDDFIVQAVPWYINNNIMAFIIGINKKDKYNLKSDTLHDISRLVRRVLSIWGYLEEIDIENELINLIVKGKFDKALLLAKRFNFNIIKDFDSKNIDTLLVVRLEEEYYKDEFLKVQIMKTIKTNFELFTNICIVGKTEKNIVGLINSKKIKNTNNKLEKIGNSIEKIFNKNNKRIKIIVYNKISKSFNDIPTNYNNLEEIVNFANVIFPLKKVFFSYELQTLYMINKMDKNTLKSLISLLEPIIIYDKINGTNYIDTLQAYLIDFNYSMKKTAENLFIHVNTLKYRIKVMKKILGYDFLQWPHKVDMFLSLIAYRLLKNKK